MRNRSFIRNLQSIEAAVLLALLCGCGGAEDIEVAQESLWEEIGEPVDRSVVAVEWHPVWTRGSIDDTLLVRPLRLRAHDDGLYVLDVQAQRVLSLDREGEVRWSFGSVGEGPGEFTRARDLRVGPSQDRIYVHDPDNGRISILDSDGAYVRGVPIRDAGHSESLVVVQDSLFVLFTRAPQDPVVVLDREGRAVRALDLPWSGFETLPGLSRQATAATDGDRWVYGFLLGNGFFPFEGLDSLDYVGRYVEHTEFPEVIVRRDGNRTSQRMARRPVCSGCSLALADDVLYVLFGGSGPEHRQIIDMYGWEEGRYLGSLPLPVAATAIEVHGDRLYVLADVPYPELTALELPPPPAR